MSNTLIANERNDFRKSALHQLRTQGNIPSVVYGKHEASKAIAVKNVDLLKVIREVGRNGIISLDVDGKSENVMLEDYQSNPITNKIIHVDFLHVDMSTEIHAQVHVVLTGSPESVAKGGILQQSLHELNISAKPKDIPEAIEVDISEIKINHAIKIEDIRKNYSKITIKHDDEEVIVTVLPPKLEEDSTSEEPAPQAAAGAEA